MIHRWNARERNKKKQNARDMKRERESQREREREKERGIDIKRKRERERCFIWDSNCASSPLPQPPYHPQGGLIGIILLSLSKTRFLRPLIMNGVGR